MKPKPSIFWNPRFCHPLPFEHRFPMEKYRLLPERLLNEQLISKEQIISPEPIPDQWILLCHHSAYWQKLNALTLPELMTRRIGFPMSAELVLREQLIAGASFQGALSALDNGLAFNIAGGTHHAAADQSEGYCLLNDAAIAAFTAIELKRCAKVLIADLDAHQGNGTAQICAHRSDIFTFSMHAAKAFPLRKVSSDLDIALNPNTGDEEYLQLLQNALNIIEHRFMPDLLIYNSGVDVLATDKLGGLSLSMKGCEMRDSIILSWCNQLKIPVLCVMGGGYSNPMETVVQAHVQTFREALRIFA